MSQQLVPVQTLPEVGRNLGMSARQVNTVQVIAIGKIAWAMTEWLRSEQLQGERADMAKSDRVFQPQKFEGALRGGRHGAMTGAMLRCNGLRENSVEKRPLAVGERLGGSGEIQSRINFNLIPYDVA